MWPADLSKYPGRRSPKDAQLLNYLRLTFYFLRSSHYKLNFRFLPLHTGALETVVVSIEVPVVAVRRCWDCGL